MKKFIFVLVLMITFTGMVFAINHEREAERIELPWSPRAHVFDLEVDGRFYVLTINNGDHARIEYRHRVGFLGRGTPTIEDIDRELRRWTAAFSNGKGRVTISYPRPGRATLSNVFAPLYARANSN